MAEDYIKFDEKIFDCDDFGFKENEVVDVLTDRRYKNSQ